MTKVMTRYQLVRDEYTTGVMRYVVYDVGTNTEPVLELGTFCQELDALLFIAAKIKADRENADANV